MTKRETIAINLLRRLYEAFAREAQWPGSEKELAMAAANKFLYSSAVSTVKERNQK